MSIKELILLLDKKKYNYIYPEAHEGHLSNRRSLQSSKENIQHFKTIPYSQFSFWGSFMPNWIRIHNTG
jgi:hypothetical protein